MRRIISAMVVLAACTAPAVAQTANNHEIAGTSMRSELHAKPVTGEPYMATKYQVIVKTLADGTTVTHHGEHTVARDSDGRVRVEHPCGCTVPNTRVVVMDPVAGTMTIWETNGKLKVASVIKLPQPRPQDDAAVVPAAQQTHDSGRPQPVVTTEDLGEQVLDGLNVTGVRTTTVVPAGRSGNNAPITKTREVWTSEDMKLVLKEISNDPRTGTVTAGLRDISRAQPDPALFRPPAGYELKDMAQTMKEVADKLAENEN
jgi:hypothetical protein